MQYLDSQPFTVPVNDGKISQLAWDRAFLSPDEFRRKYGAEQVEPGDQDHGR
jgi:hypothetical protein